MKALMDLICKNLTGDEPPIVRDAMLMMRDRFNSPIKPIMTQKEFDALI